MYHRRKTKLISRFLSVLLTVTLTLTLFSEAVLKADTVDNVTEIRLYSTITSVNEGPLIRPKPYLSVSNDAPYEIYSIPLWAEYRSHKWETYSTQYHVAISGDTHYGIEVEFELDETPGLINFYLNDQIYNTVGFSHVEQVYKNYVTIIFDLGTAIPKVQDDSLPSLQNVSLNGNELSWDPMNGAAYYFVTIADTETGRVYGGLTEATHINLCAMLSHPASDGIYIIAVNAMDKHLVYGGKQISKMWSGWYHSPEATGKSPYLNGDITRELQDDSKPDLYHYNMVRTGDYASIPDSSMHVLYEYDYIYEGLAYYADNDTFSFSATPCAELWVRCYIYMDGYDYAWYVSMAIHQDNGDMDGHISIIGDAVPESTISAQVTGMDLAFPENLVYTWQIRNDEKDYWKNISEKKGSSELLIDASYETKELRLVVTYPDVFSGKLESEPIKVKYHPSRVFPISFIVYENGYAAISAKEATVGTQIYVAATPCIGYEVEAIWYRPAGGKFVNIADDPTFSMPTECATVEVTFRPKTASSAPSFADFVERLYTVALDRPSEPDGKAYWVDQVVNKGLTGADCARFFMLGAPEFLGRNLSDDAFVEVLYKTYFGRDSEPDGKAYWLARLASGDERALLVEEFIESVEWCNICATYGVKSGAIYHKATIPSKNAKDFASRLYICCLGRVPENDGLSYWSLALTNLDATGYQAASLFFTSTEFTGFGLTDEEYVVRLYRTFMGREPDEDGQAYWLSLLKGGTSRLDAMKSFAGCPEFQVICNEYGMDRGVIE